MQLDKSILADEDIKDEECDLSMDGDEVLPALDEEQQVEQEKAITFMNSMRAKGVESVKLLLMGEVEKALELVTPHVNSHPLMANATAYIAYYEAMIAFDTKKIPTAKNKVSISQKMCKLMMQRSRKQLSHKKGVQRGSLPEPHLAAIVTYYEARIAIADCWLFTSVLTATKMAFTAYVHLILGRVADEACLRNLQEGVQRAASREASQAAVPRREWSKGENQIVDELFNGVWAPAHGAVPHSSLSATPHEDHRDGGRQADWTPRIEVLCRERVGGWIGGQSPLRPVRPCVVLHLPETIHYSF